MEFHVEPQRFVLKFNDLLFCCRIDIGNALLDFNRFIYRSNDLAVMFNLFV